MCLVLPLILVGLESLNCLDFEIMRSRLYTDTLGQQLGNFTPADLETYNPQQTGATGKTSYTGIPGYDPAQESVTPAGVQPPVVAPGVYAPPSSTGDPGGRGALGSEAYGSDFDTREMSDLDRLTADNIPGFDFGRMLGMPATGMFNAMSRFGFNPAVAKAALGAVGLPLGIVTGLNTLGGSVANSARFGMARDKALSGLGYSPSEAKTVAQAYADRAPVSLHGMQAHKAMADLETQAHGWPSTLTGYISRMLGAPVRAFATSMTPAVDDNSAGGSRGGYQGTFGEAFSDPLADIGMPDSFSEAATSLTSTTNEAIDRLSAISDSVLGGRFGMIGRGSGSSGGGYADTGYSGGAEGSYGDRHGGHHSGFSPAAEEGWGRDEGGWGDIGGEGTGTGGTNDGSTGGGIAGGSIGGAGDDGYGGL